MSNPLHVFTCASPAWLKAPLKDSIYLIEARTGCTCCSGDNFIEGPFETKDEAASSSTTRGS